MKYSLILIAFVYSFGSNMIMAQDTKTYNGSYCSAADGNDVQNVLRNLRGIRNNNANAIRISCPIIEDAVNVVTGTQAVRVHYTGPGMFVCNLLSMNGNGSVRESRFEARFGTGWINFNPQITTDDFFGTYSMICSLPTNGTLNTIWFRERT